MQAEFSKLEVSRLEHELLEICLLEMNNLAKGIQSAAGGFIDGLEDYQNSPYCKVMY